MPSNNTWAENGASANETTALLLPGDTADEVTVMVTTPTGGRLALILGTSYVGVYLGAVDASIMATLSGPISSEFQALSLLSWLATAYLIANAACQPLWGRLTDIFGRGPGLVFCNVLFALGNLICGLSKGPFTMIFGRVVAGVGGGGLMSISTFLASDLVPLNRRGLIQGIGNTVYGFGAMTGGVFGGLANDVSSLGWRLAFLIQVPIVLVSAVLVHFLVKVPPKMSNKSLVSRIDFVGGMLMVTCLVLLLLGLNSGGNLVPWTHPLVLATIPVSALVLAVFVWWEDRSRQPMLPVRLLGHRTVAAACATNLLCTMVMLMSSYYLPLYLQVLGATPTQAALRIAGSPVGLAPFSIGAGYIMKRTGRYVLLGSAMVAVSAASVAGLIATTFEGSPAWIPFTCMLFLGGGYGGMLTVTLLACIAAVDHAQQAVVTSATYAFRSVGGTLGITVASAVYQNVLGAHLWARFGHRPGAADEIARIKDDLAELGRLPPGWYDGVIASFMEAFRAVWWTGTGLLVVAWVCASLMKQHKLYSSLSRL